MKMPYACTVLMPPSLAEAMSPNSVRISFKRCHSTPRFESVAQRGNERFTVTAWMGIIEAMPSRRQFLADFPARAFDLTLIAAKVAVIHIPCEF